MKNSKILKVAIASSLVASLAATAAISASAAGIGKVDDIKDKIYELYLDVEEKADILNKISKYKTTNSPKEKKELAREIESFIKEYNLE